MGRRWEGGGKVVGRQWEGGGKPQATGTGSGQRRGSGCTPRGSPKPRPGSLLRQALPEERRMEEGKTSSEEEKVKVAGSKLRGTLDESPVPRCRGSCVPGRAPLRAPCHAGWCRGDCRPPAPAKPSSAGGEFFKGPLPCKC